jgi:hypothetical protein
MKLHEAPLSIKMAVLDVLLMWPAKVISSTVSVHAVPTVECDALESV